MGVIRQPGEAVTVGKRPPAGDSVGVSDAARERDEATDVLFRRHCLDLVGVAFCLLGDRGAAEEVVQDAFVTLHRHWPGLRDQASALAYLRAAVINGCRSRQRRLVRARELLPALATAAAQVSSSEDTAVGRDEASRLAVAVRSLPTRQREVLVCRFYLELTETQTAALLQIARRSVKTHANRALAGLARRLEVTP
jgi:RNA polymerase sigma factor (sigma-70 family)